MTTFKWKQTALLNINAKIDRIISIDDDTLIFIESKPIIIERVIIIKYDIRLHKYSKISNKLETITNKYTAFNDTFCYIYHNELNNSIYFLVDDRLEMTKYCLNENKWEYISKKIIGGSTDTYPSFMFSHNNELWIIDDQGRCMIYDELKNKVHPIISKNTIKDSHTGTDGVPFEI